MSLFEPQPQLNRESLWFHVARRVADGLRQTGRVPVCRQTPQALGPRQYLE